MKSPGTLISAHEKAIEVLQLLAQAKDRVTLYKGHLKMWKDNRKYTWVHGSYRREQEIIDKIIASHRVYQRIKNYYLNHLKKIR